MAIEDERFYEHNGIDIQGILRAGVVGVMNGFDFTEGASTLTQQLIKNNVFDFVNEKTFFDRVERKLQEQYLALAFEKEMNKNEILEAYLNTINLGQGCLGVQTASTRYFNKDVADLTLSECAVIAAITQNPTEYDPVTNPESNAKRREKVLGNMLEQKYIDQAQYDEALADLCMTAFYRQPRSPKIQRLTLIYRCLDRRCHSRSYGRERLLGNTGL